MKFLKFRKLNSFIAKVPQKAPVPSAKPRINSRKEKAQNQARIDENNERKSKRKHKVTNKSMNRFHIVFSNLSHPKNIPKTERNQSKF